MESLDRFVGVNREAFQKILKKYRRWTSSTSLEQRFVDNVLSRSPSFTMRNLVPALTHYNVILASIRNALFPPTPAKPLEPSSKTSIHDSVHVQWSSIAANLQYIFEMGSNVDFDTLMAVSAAGAQTGHACYWVHVDNLLQVQILLSQHMKSRKKSVSPSVTMSPSMRRSSRTPVKASIDREAQSDAKARVILCGDFQDFAPNGSSSKIFTSRISEDILEKSISASIRLSGTDEAMVVISVPRRDTDGPVKKNKTCQYQAAKFQRKALTGLFLADVGAREAESPKARARGDSDGMKEVCAKYASCIEMVPVADVQRAFHQNKRLQPLAEVRSTRSRLAGIQNTKSSGLWATVDKDVVMSKCSKSFLCEEFGSSPDGKHSPFPFVPFPHAILRIRYEGLADLGLIKKLDSSHLTEKVNGFTMDFHAIALLYGSRAMSSQCWDQALSQDIQNIPISETGKLSGSTPRKDNTESSENAASNSDEPTDSGFSTRLKSSDTSAPEDPGLAPFVIQKRKKLPKRSALRETEDPPPNVYTRYWNEFDDLEGDQGDDTYKVTVEAQPSIHVPGLTTLFRMAQAAVYKVKTLTYQQQGSEAEHRPLLGEQRESTRLSSDESDLEEGTMSTAYQPFKRGVSFICRDSLDSAPSTREKHLRGLCFASFLLSFVLLGIGAILVNTSRRKAVHESDIGVLMGVIFSVVLSVGGLWSTASMADKVGLMWWTTVFVLNIIAFIGNGYLLIILL